MALMPSRPTVVITAAMIRPAIRVSIMLKPDDSVDRFWFDRGSTNGCFIEIGWFTDGVHRILLSSSTDLQNYFKSDRFA